MVLFCAPYLYNLLVDIENWECLFEIRIKFDGISIQQGIDI